MDFFLTPLRIDGEIDRDPIDPSIKRRTALKTAYLAVGPEESFLGYLERVFAVTQQPENHHVNFLMVTGNELLKCTHLAGLALLNQFLSVSSTMTLPD